MQKWEYAYLAYVYKPSGIRYRWEWEDDKNNNMDIVDRLNYFGEKGWELVSCGGTVSGNSETYTFILKRPKP